MCFALGKASLGNKTKKRESSTKSQNLFDSEEHCRHLASAAGGFGCTGKGLKISWSQRPSNAGEYEEENTESIKYAENAAEMYESNTQESLLSGVGIVKTKGYKGIEREFPFPHPPPSGHRVNILFCCTPCFLFSFSFLNPRGYF